jgi:hypothetical protein
MNERIQELAKEAGLIQAKDFKSGDEVKNIVFSNGLEKFAESIIKECSGIVENQGKFLRYDVLAKKIKDHFEIKK